MPHILLDAMGGDHAPKAIVQGAVEALLAYPEAELTLVGPGDAIEAELSGASYDASRLHIMPASQVITNEESPALAVRRKRDSTMVVGLNMLKDKKADALITAGSTGAILVASLLILKTLAGIHRPALAPLLPTINGRVMLIDCGANVDAKPMHLEQFALMGSAYMQAVEGIENPRVGLVNVGAEEEKGNELTKAAYPLLKRLPINFVGNVEGRDILLDAADVVVCDAFAGNIILKHTEGMAKALTTLLKRELTSKPAYKLMAAGLRGAFRSFRDSMDYTQYGGAPLLGLNGCVIKSHGSSDPTAIVSSVRQAIGFVEKDLVGKIAAKLSEIHDAGNPSHHEE
ncbi:MAG: phosphate acyltransferase PlsX [Christensenellales bacterium]|jgi:glycerol-3-phosphate acyltransferase PlsX